MLSDFGARHPIPIEDVAVDAIKDNDNLVSLLVDTRIGFFDIFGAAKRVTNNSNAPC